jgi:hypothetical protein
MGEYELSGVGDAGDFAAGVGSSAILAGWAACAVGGFLAGRALGRGDKKNEYGVVGAVICGALGPLGVLGLGIMAAVTADGR